MRLRETLRAGGLVALSLALLSGCGPDVRPETPVSLEGARTPAQLRAILDEIQERRDPEANLARGRVYARLRELENPGSGHLLAAGDGADFEVLASPAPPEYKGESAGRLAGHFRERAEREGLCRSRFKGPLAGPLRRFVMLSVAVTLGEYLPRAELAQLLRQASAAARDIAQVEVLKPPLARRWARGAGLLSRRAEEQEKESQPPEPTPEARKFCEMELSRHLDEATRASAQATKEMADRGDDVLVMEGYLRALEHFVVARECLESPTRPQEDTLGAMEIVIDSLLRVVVKEP